MSRRDYGRTPADQIARTAAGSQARISDRLRSAEAFLKPLEPVVQQGSTVVVAGQLQVLSAEHREQHVVEPADRASGVAVTHRVVHRGRVDAVEDGIDPLDGVLNRIDTTAVNDAMGYRYPAGAVRRLDDVLLAVFGTRYLQLAGNDDRTALLDNRFQRLSEKFG